MRADFVNEVARALNVKRKDLIEKDIILHQILTDLSHNNFFADNFLFKGGTCLITSYIGYTRFSEDIDFTWKDQTVFSNLSGMKLRSRLSKLINTIGTIFENIAEKNGFDFKCIKSNPEYVELGGSNKTCTLKIWYDSEIMKRRTFVKVQLNFVEQMCFLPKRRQLNGLLTGTRAPQLMALFPNETIEYSKRIPFNVYDIREILSEKVRAILTRQGTKARDFVDLYLIWKKSGKTPKDEKKCILGKIDFSLKHYEKYRRHLSQKITLLKSGKLFNWGEEKGLLLSKLDDEDFYKFLNDFMKFLKDLVDALEQ